MTLFNRPDVTQQLFVELARVKPTRLYVACDGPTNDSDSRELVRRVREVVSAAIDWDCELHTLYQESNLGCQDGMVTALDWFFSQVGEGIILEDDCLPSASFFDLATTFLDTYRNDEAVWGVTGDNSAGVRISGSETVGFSHYALIWGWATWADRWARYDRDLTVYNSMREPAFSWSNIFEKAVFSKSLESILHTGLPDTWDVQWAWTVMLHRGLWAIPRDNLITNIGFGEAASHTHTPTNRSRAARREIPGPISLPDTPKPSRIVDAHVLGRVHKAHRLVLDKMVTSLRKPVPQAARSSDRPK